MLARALGILEAHVLEPSSGDGGVDSVVQGQVRGALSDVVTYALQSSGGGGQQAYALQVILSLTRRSDPKYKTFFSVLDELGVPLDTQHTHVAAVQDLDALTHALLNSNQDFLPMLGSRSTPCRVQIKDASWWPQICSLLVSFALSSPFLRVKVLASTVLPDWESFLELIPATGNTTRRPLEGVVLHLGDAALKDPAFLASLWATASPHMSTFSIQGVASRHILSSLMRDVFSLAPFPNYAVLPLPLLLGAENCLSQFCRAAEQLILSNASRRGLHGGHHHISNCDAILQAPDHDSGAERVVWLEDVKNMLATQASVALQCHLQTSGWKLQQLAVHYVSSFLDLEGPVSATPKTKKAKKAQGEEAANAVDGDVLLVLHFAWTGGSVISEEQRESMTALAKQLTTAVQEPKSFHATLARFWEQQQQQMQEEQGASASVEVTNRLIVSVHFCLAILEALLAASPATDQKSTLRLVLDALLEVCRSGIALANSPDSDKCWSLATAAAGRVGIALVLAAAEALNEKRTLEPVASSDLGRLWGLLTLTCCEEGAALCDVVRTLPPAEATVLLQRLGQKSY